jgi:hypothetical protein
MMTVPGRTSHPTPLRATLLLGAVFVLLKLALHIAANIAASHAGYGIFRDELYYLVCGRNLDWGYLDQPPLVALQAAFAEHVFGLHSLVLFRLLPALCGAATIVLAALMARVLGGGRLAQVLAMSGVLLAPMIIGTDGNLSMNATEPVFWMTSMLALLLLARGGSAHPGLLWTTIGIAAGLGIENKWNIVFFLISLLLALIVSPQRRLLRTPWLAVAIAIIVAIAAPNFWWEYQRHWPTLEWLHNDAVGGKNIRLAPLPFILNQLRVMNPIGALLWVPSIGWLLFARSARPFRFAGILYLIYLPMMIALGAKDYYLAPIYPLYFAAGGAAWNEWLRRPWQRLVLAPAYLASLAALAAVALPLTLPVVSPEAYVRYTQRLGQHPQETQTFDHAPLPQYFADQRGWPQMADALANAYLALPPEQRARAVIYGTNYGEAAAVAIYRPDVPTAISGHQNFYYWGPRGHDGSVMVIIGDSRATDEREFQSVTEVPWRPDPFTEPYEQKPIFVCRQPKGFDLQSMWPKIKSWY